MVLGGRLPGRVGRCRNLFQTASLRISIDFGGGAVAVLSLDLRVRLCHISHFEFVATVFQAPLVYRIRVFTHAVKTTWSYAKGYREWSERGQAQGNGPHSEGCFASYCIEGLLFFKGSPEINPTTDVGFKSSVVFKTAASDLRRGERPSSDPPKIPARSFSFSD